VTVILGDEIRKALIATMERLYFALYNDHNYRKDCFTQQLDFQQARLHLKTLCCLDELCNEVQAVLKKVNTRNRIDPKKFMIVWPKEKLEKNNKALKLYSEEEKLLQDSLRKLFPDLSASSSKLKQALEDFSEA
jgi:hypothetical protein